MARLRSYSSRVVYSVRQRDYGARNPLRGVRFMFVVAALLFTTNPAMAADPSCTSDKPDECFLPQDHSDIAFDVKAAFAQYKDGEVTVDDPDVKITLLSDTENPNWPSVKVVAPKGLTIVVSAQNPKQDANQVFTYSIGNLQFTFRWTISTKNKYWNADLECIGSSGKIPFGDKGGIIPEVTVKLSADGKVKASHSGKPESEMECRVYTPNVIVINPAGADIDPPGTGASVTMDLKDAKIMLSKGLQPTTAPPTTTGNGPCVNGTCESYTCENGTSVNSTCVNGACETVTCVNVTCENGTSVNSTSVNSTCVNSTCVNGTCGNGTDLNTTTTSSPAFPPWAIGAAAGGGVLLLLVIIGILVYFFVIRRRKKPQKAAKNGKSKEAAKKPNKEARPEEEPPTDLKSGVKDAPKSKGQELPPDQPPVDGAPAPAPAADPTAPAADPAPVPATGDQYENLAPPPQ